MRSNAGFTDNALETREDLVVAAKALLRPIERYRSPGGALVKIRPQTVAGFDDVAAQIEGFSRPLLAIGAFLGQDGHEQLRIWMRGLASGVDPKGSEYWGDMGDFDQRMVETESICVALLTAPDELLPLLAEADKTNLKVWLRQINDRVMPANNWRWFRVFVNLALKKVLGVPEEEVAETMRKDFELLDSFELSDGWSSDGPWGDQRRQADYYSGSFAIQFAQLLYVRHCSEDEARVEKYKSQARDFSRDYWRYFDVNGAAIPFGRSMTYRFAFAAFWAAAAIAGVELPAPVEDLGTVKGLLLRHLRWWAKHPDMLTSDGILNIGFTYPNMYLSEDYNSPQSVYWCLKSFVVLELPSAHPFWQCKEKPHPLVPGEQSGLERNKFMQSPGQLVVSAPEHHYMLSFSQMTTKPHKAKAAKYCKFAYSSHYSFSVPAGTSLTQLAPDNTICVSTDGGETWKVRDTPTNSRTGVIPITRDDSTVNETGLISTWVPWKQVGLEIETTLVAAERFWPGWHIRIHHVKWAGDVARKLLSGELRLLEGGFAIPSFTSTGHHVRQTSNDMSDPDTYGNTTDASWIWSRNGAGGLATLWTKHQRQGVADNTVPLTSETFVLRADPNTNLIHPRTFIPCAMHTLDYSAKTECAAETLEGDIWIVSGVFAAVPSRREDLDIPTLWRQRPQIVSTPDGLSIHI